MIASLTAAIDEAISRDDLDRALRLLIQNLPRFPRRPSLRRYVAEIGDRIGRSEDAASLALHVHDMELRAGELLGALTSLKLAESYGADATGRWDVLFDALEARSFGALAPPPDEPEPDLEATRPQLERSALFDVAAEMAARPAPSVVATNMLDAVPLLATLPTPLLRRTLLRLAVRHAAPGERLVGRAGAAWLVGGEAVDHTGASVFRGALVPARDDAPSAGPAGATLLELTAEAWDELVALEPFARAWGELSERWRMLGTLHGAALTQALSPRGRAALVRGLELVRTGPCTVVEGGTRPPGLFVVTDGELQMKRCDDGTVVNVLRQGAVFGDALDEPPMSHEIVCGASASFALLRVELLRELLETEPAARDLLRESWNERHGIPGRLDTSEVQILEDGPV